MRISELSDQDIIAWGMRPVDEALRGDSLSDFVMAIEILKRLPEEADALEDTLVEIALTKGSRGREAFVAWLGYRGIWKSGFAEPISEALCDPQTLVRADAIGLVAKWAPKSVSDIGQVLFGASFGRSSGTPTVVLSRKLDETKRKSGAEGWILREMKAKRQFRGLLFAQLLANGEKMSGIRSHLIEEDSLVFAHLHYYHGYP